MQKQNWERKDEGVLPWEALEDILNERNQSQSDEHLIELFLITV